MIIFRLAHLIEVVGRLSNEQPGTPGGSLTSKPTWWIACGRSATSAFLFSIALLVST